MIRPGHALTSALLFLVSAFGCAGTETGNPPATDGTVEVGVLPTDAGFVAPSEVDADVLARADELGQVHLALARLELLPVGSCGALAGAEDAFVAGVVEVDRPSTGTFTAPPGSYCALRLWLRLADDDDPGVPELVRGHALAVRFVDAAGVPYVTLLSDRTDPIVLYAEQGAFALSEGASTVTLLVDAVGALVAREFWLEAPEPDGSWVFDEAGDADFLRLFESTPELFRLFLGVAPAVPAPPDGGGGGGAGGGGGSGVDELGPALASSNPP